MEDFYRLSGEPPENKLFAGMTMTVSLCTPYFSHLVCSSYVQEITIYLRENVTRTSVVMLNNMSPASQLLKC